MVMVPQKVLKGRLTYQDYLGLPDDQDYEIIEGVLYVAPRPAPFHQVVANRLAFDLTGHVEGRGLGLVVPDADLIIHPKDVYVSPDIMVFLGKRVRAIPRRGRIRTPPDLIVEVLSPSTERRDRSTKWRVYAELGVPHYWMADPDERAINECVLGAEGQYHERAFTAPDVFRPALLPDLAIDLARLFEWSS